MIEDRPADGEAPPNERLSWLILIFGVVVAWWLPFLSEPILTFYKEWLFAVGLAFAGLLAAPSSNAGAWPRRHPLIIAAAAVAAVLIMQAFSMDGVWRPATLTFFCVVFFVFAIVLGRRMLRRRGEDSLPMLAWSLWIAALGSCVFAVLQVFKGSVPFVVSRSGDRLYGNVAQANHFADLLWIGAVAAVFLHSRGRLRRIPATLSVLVLEAFSVTSGSRMAWLYAVVIMLLGAAVWLRRPSVEMRRLAIGLVAMSVVYLPVVVAVSASGVLETFGITSAEQRTASGTAAESTRQRLWFWRAGVDAALKHPWIGVGVGRLPGHSLDLAMRVPDSPPHAADAQAHNIFVQLAAELGIPLATLVAFCAFRWLVTAWRQSPHGPTTLGAIAMAVPILIHANLEHPLGYLYFLGLLGLLAGHVPDAPVVASVAAHRESPNLLRFASFAVLAVAALTYVQFSQVERAMRVVLAQTQAGAPPQPSQSLGMRLQAIPTWSIFGTYADLIALVTVLPTQGNAGELGRRCEAAMPFGPTPHLLARCATALQVAGRTERATYFADSLCKVYPASVGVLIQSMTFVEKASPAVADLRSSCVDKAN